MTVMNLKSEQYLRRNLRVMPLALAVLRAIEAKNIDMVKLKSPVIDLGCGSGEFARGNFTQTIDVGVEISNAEIIRAKEAQVYKSLVCADARFMPFADESIKTVISISTLEHVNNVNQVLEEVRRVLMPGGQLAMSVNTPKIGEMLYWPQVLKKLGWVRLAESYLGFFHRVFKHHTLWDKKSWEKALTGQGFRLIKIKEIFSPEAVRHFDRWLPTSLLAQAFQLVNNKRWVWRPGWLNKWLVNRYGWLVTGDEQIGGNLFILAVKT